jgi:uncharacterized protein (DUF58 family)
VATAQTTSAEPGASCPAPPVAGPFARTFETLWRYSWWLAVLAGLLAFALQRYVALLFLLGTWFVITLIVKSARWFGRARTGARPAQPLRYHFTPWGVFVFGLTVCASAAALSTGISLLYVVAGLMAAFLMSSMVLAGAYLGRLEIDWLVPDHVFSGHPFKIKLTIRNGKRFFPSYGLLIEDAVRWGHQTTTQTGKMLYLPARSQISVEYDMTVPRRGVHGVDPLVISSSFPLGLLEGVLELPRRRELLVLPRLGDIRGHYVFQRRSLEQNVLRHSLPDDRQIEFFGAREYRHGDSLRHVHWRTSARKGRLFVKEFERQEGKNVLMLLDTCVPRADRKLRVRREMNLEHAVSFCASLAELLLKNSSFYAFAAFCPEFRAIHFDSGRGHFFHVLETLARVQPSRERNLIDLTAELDPLLFKNGLIVAVSLGDLPRLRVHDQLARRAVLVNTDTPEFHHGFVIR